MDLDTLLFLYLPLLDSAVLWTFGIGFIIHLFYRYRRFFTISAPDLYAIASFNPSALSVGSRFNSNNSGSSHSSSSFSSASLMFRFGVAVALVSMADWVQGAPVYGTLPMPVEYLALVRAYSLVSMVVLHLVWWLPGLLVGPLLAASVAEHFGRRTACLTHCAILLASNLAVHLSRDFWAVIVSRVLGGIGTTALYNSFEMWLLAKHHQQQRGHGAAAAAAAADYSMMMEIFFVVRFASSMAAGYVQSWAFELYQAHPHYSFDAATVLLLLAVAVIYRTWDETPTALFRGRSACDIVRAVTASVSSTWRAAFSQLWGDRAARALCLAHTAFEFLAIITLFASKPVWMIVLADVMSKRSPYSHASLFPYFFLAMASGAASQSSVAQFFATPSSSSSSQQQQQQQIQVFSKFVVPSTILLLIFTVASTSMQLRVLLVAGYVMIFFIIGVALQNIVVLRSTLPIFNLQHAVADASSSISSSSSCSNSNRRGAVLMLFRLPALALTAFLVYPREESSLLWFFIMNKFWVTIKVFAAAYGGLLIIVALLVRRYVENVVPEAVVAMSSNV